LTTSLVALDVVIVGAVDFAVSVASALVVAPAQPATPSAMAMQTTIVAMFRMLVPMALLARR
jgi:hypothetical protein